MNIGKKLAIASMALNLAASLGYFVYGDIRKGIYWLSAAILTASVTF